MAENIMAHAIYGAVMTTQGPEAWHFNVEIHHPDGTISKIGSGYTSDVKAREQFAIDSWKALNAEKLTYEANWS